MGCYGYICKSCGLSVRGEEKAHLIHVRHGKIIGETEGAYNYYGGVEEDNIFDRWEKIADGNPNNHAEIMKSCHDYADSANAPKERQFLKIYNGKPVSLVAFAEIKNKENPNKFPRKKDCEIKYDWDLQDLVKEEYERLDDNPSIPSKASGVIAYHKKCYEIAKKKGQISIEPSDNDIDQSCGKPRKRFL